MRQFGPHHLWRCTPCRGLSAPPIGSCIANRCCERRGAMEIPNEEARRVFAGGHFLRLGATQPSSIDWKRDPIVGLKTLSSEPFSCGDSRAPSEAGFLQPTEDPAVATSSLAAGESYRP